jgi:hypothetical protein
LNSAQPQQSDPISRQVTGPGHHTPPDAATPSGYAWLINRYALRLPRPPRLAAIARRHRPGETDGWLLLPEGYAPAESLAEQLTFALKWEGVNLAALHALFHTIPASDIVAAVSSAPTGAYLRRVWFLYEWLTGTTLDLPDLGKVTAVPVVDPEMQLGLGHGELSTRHRVRNNLPGTPAFCPMVRCTPRIAAWQQADLGNEARQVIGRTHADVMTRAAAFLLLSDSRASYGIEGERPSHDRVARWAQAIARAGATRLSMAELDALQRTVIGDARFVQLGLRVHGGFVGQHDRVTRQPLPDHISARADDLESLVAGIVAFDERTTGAGMDAVAAAAAIAFGFVYVHPFEDGNGRIHRWLVHHVLSVSGFSPAGLVFPVSAVMLREIEAYRRVLESYSRALLPCIEWEATTAGNVQVLNDTAPWYRYFDATAHAEFLYSCVEATIRADLPYEVAYLIAYDRFAEGVAAIADMPRTTVDLLHHFLAQNGGTLSNRARTREFSALTDDEAMKIEALYEAAMKERALINPS